jgi:hypothetical protein
MDVHVLFVHGRVYDAFWGSGWENWTRFLIKGKEVIYIKGQKITNEQKKILLSRVNADETAA